MRNPKIKITAIVIVAGLIIAGVGFVFAQSYSSAQLNTLDTPTVNTVATTTATTTAEIIINPKAEINALKGKTGTEFDKYFLLQMMLYHQIQTAIAQIALTNSNNDQVKSFANTEISENQAETSQLVQWYQQWFQ